MSESEGPKRQIRREEIAMQIANGIHRDEVLDIIEAALEGNSTDEMMRVARAVLAGVYDPPVGWDLSISGGAWEKPCPECEGSGKHPFSEMSKLVGGLGKHDVCPTCHGTGKKQE